MLESIFIMLMAMAFITFLLGIDDESFPMCLISAVLWLIVFASAHYIQVPMDTDYAEMSINAISIAFIFINIILAVVFYFEYSFKQNMP